MLFKHTKPFDGCDEYMFEGQVNLLNCDVNINKKNISFIIIF